MDNKVRKDYSTLSLILLIGFAFLVLFNHWQISTVSAAVGASEKSSFTFSGFSNNNGDLSDVDLTEIKSTAQAVNALFDLSEGSTAEEVIAIMVPTGVPEYGEEMGVSFDDPVNSLNLMAQKLYPQINNEIKQNDPEIWARYLNLAAAPTGISCEFCCGIGAQGITDDGKSRCGCQHNPAVLGLTLWLMKNTDYTDAEILKEVMKWKTLFFPKAMVQIGLDISGGDASALADAPSMVGGC